MHAKNKVFFCLFIWHQWWLFTSQQIHICFQWPLTFYVKIKFINYAWSDWLWSLITIGQKYSCKRRDSITYTDRQTNLKIYIFAHLLRRRHITKLRGIQHSLLLYHIPADFMRKQQSRRGFIDQCYNTYNLHVSLVYSYSLMFLFWQSTDSNHQSFPISVPSLIFCE